VIEEYPELGTDAAAGLDDPWLSAMNHLLSMRLLQIVDLDVQGLTPLTVRMHRIVQETLHKRLSNKDDLLQKLCELGIERSEYLEKYWHLKSTQWEINPLVLFSYHLLERSHPLATKIVTYLGELLLQIYSFHGYKELHVKAIEQLKKDPSSEQTEIAILLSNLAAAQLYLGDLREAKGFLKMAIEIDEKYREPTHRF